MVSNAESCISSNEGLQGFERVDKIIELNDYLRESLKPLKNITLDNFKDLGIKFLPNKTLFKVKGLTGEEIYNKLLLSNIRAEKYTNLACVITICFLNNREDIQALINAVT
jgi:hypothetical protein